MEPHVEIERSLAQVIAYLHNELGYQSDGPGSLPRRVEENEQMIRSIDETLRGRGDELGLVGWVMVLRRSWITIVAMLGAAFGYFLNDVVDTFGGRVNGATHASRQVEK